MRCHLCKLATNIDTDYFTQDGRTYHIKCHLLRSVNPSLADALAFVGEEADKEFLRSDKQEGADYRYRAYDTVRMHIYHMIGNL